MFPSTPTSNLTPKGFLRTDGLAEHHPTRPRIPLAERIQRRINQLQGRDENESPSKNKRTERGPSKFGRERMTRARSGHFRRLSLERACLSARGEDALSVSSGQPLSGNSLGLWEGSCLSASGVNLNYSGTGSSRINVNAEHPLLGAFSTPVENNVSRIQTSASTTMLPQLNSPDASVNMRKNPLHDYYTLKSEAETALLESKKQWVDTPYSVSVVQDFEPLYDAEIIESILQESLTNYKPLPSEFLRRRSTSRISCRMSPYANVRKSRLMSPQDIPPSPSPSLKRKRNAVIPKANSPLSDVLTNWNNCSTPALAAKSKSILRPALLDRQSVPLNTPLRTKSLGTPTGKRTIGSEKRAKNKENLFQDPPKTPGGPLRVDRPRPRYRTPTPGRKRRPAKE